MTLFIVRHINPEAHVDSLLGLQEAILPWDAPVDPLDASGRWWLAMDAMEPEDPVAFASWHPSKRFPGDTIYLSRAGVLEAARGAGLQRRLIKVRLRNGKREGYGWAVSDTFENTPSANNLIRCGFTLYEPSLEYGTKGTLYWKRKL